VTGIVPTLTCPACGLVITDRWEAEIVFEDGLPETVTYCQCRRCHRAKHPQARRPPVISTNRTRSVEVVGLNGTMIMEVVE